MFLAGRQGLLKFTRAAKSANKYTHPCAPRPPTRALDPLNTLTNAAFAQALGEVFEPAPWVAEAALNVGANME